MNYFGDCGGNERSSSTSAGGSSSRKGKKSSSDKPKQPQRGLGVAQLEKIRLHSQMGFLPQEDISRIQTAAYTSSSSSSSSFSYTSPSTASFSTSFQGHHSHMMGMGELERTNVVYGDQSQLAASSNHRWAGDPMLEAQRYTQHAAAGINRHFFSPELLEDSSSSRKKKRKDQNDSMSGSTQNSDSNGSQQELDLELRLAL